MDLKEINPVKTPELFYCSRVDGEQTIYDQIAEDTSDSTDAIRSLKRKVQGGDAEFKMYSDHIEIWYNDSKVAGADLVAEYFTTDWQSQAFDFSSATITKINDGTFRFLVKQGDNIFGLEWSFAYGIPTKQTFYLDVPSRLVRIRWRVEVLENALAANRDDEKGLKYSVEDYTGEVQHNTPGHPTDGWAYHIWLFEPDGKTCDVVDTRTSLERYQQGAGLVVDPYISLSEVSTDIIVTAEDILTFGDTYSATILENTPTRVIIQETDITSTIYSSVMLQYGDGTSDLTGNDYSAIEISDVAALFNWFPLSSDMYDDRTAITSQYQNESDLTITTGTAITSGTGVTSIGTDGFGSDGAYHIETEDV